MVCTTLRIWFHLGKSPDKRVIRLRKGPKDNWGLLVEVPENDFPRVLHIVGGSQIARTGSINLGEQVFSINGESTKGTTSSRFAEIISALETMTLEVGASNDEVSSHSACPYYLSRGLEKHADLVFCPYNYILDPAIRLSLGIELERTVVVLDEAHNVESVLRDSGSGTWGEFDLCEIVAELQQYATLECVAKPNSQNDKEDLGQTVPLNKMAHELLVFLETFVLHLRDCKVIFEQRGGISNAIREWEQFHTKDDKMFEMTYDGPSGYGFNGECIGCKTFFQKTNLEQRDKKTLLGFASALEKIARRSGNLKHANVFKKLLDFVTKIASAMEEPQHYFIQTSLKANGCFSFAAGREQGALVSQRSGGPNPLSLPDATGRSCRNPNGRSEPCHFCTPAKGHSAIFIDNRIWHGSYCDGSVPKWEAVLHLNLLTPSLFMRDIAGKCRSVILASGSLSPLDALCCELGLRASRQISETEKSVEDGTDNHDSVNQFKQDRLQILPKPLEADHVISLEKQLMAVAIGHFSDGEQLTVTFNRYKCDKFIQKMGHAIATIIESIPKGGVLVFLPSYSLLQRCINLWKAQLDNRASTIDLPHLSEVIVWDRLERSKGKVIIEPYGNQSDFEASKADYARTIRETGNCILLAVFRGKMSEGISFNDDNARGVISVGIPYPSSLDRAVKAKISYNDEQLRVSKRTDFLPGKAWFSQQAFRAIAQALGRCIRHIGDYGTLFLLDSRLCDESPPNQDGVCEAHSSLPKWMRSHVKTLTRTSCPDSFGKTMHGGWASLKPSMQEFFAEASVYTERIVQEQKESLARGRKNADGDLGLACLPHCV